MTKPKPRPPREKPTADVSKSSAVKYVGGKWGKDEKVPPPGNGGKDGK